MSKKVCPKCQFSMTEGILVPVRFVEGSVKDKRKISHGKLEELDKMKGKAVIAYACSNCGYIELSRGA